MDPNETSVNPPMIHLPKGIHHTCIQCGRSCEDFAEIPVDPTMAESIRGRSPESLGDAPDPGNAVVDSPWTEGGLAMRTDDQGRCCMLTEDHRCTLHAAFGAAAKPCGCRSFPYRFIETPGGVYAGLSFACTAVLGNKGPAVADQAAEIDGIYVLGSDRRRVGGELWLDGDIPISWSQYLRIEEDLTEMLDPELGTIDTRLLAQAVYLQLLVRALREVRRESGVLDAAAEVNEAMMGAFRKQMRGDVHALWGPIFQMARRSHRPRVLRRTLLGFACSLRHAYGKRRGHLRAYPVMLDAYLRHSLGWGRLELPLRGRSVSQRNIRRMHFDPVMPDHDELATRYFTHCLQRKDLLGEEPVLFQHSMMLMHWGLVHWYSAGFAADEKCDRVELEHLREGLRSVEKYYVFHSTFSRIFRDNPVMRGMIDRMFAHPRYPYAMCRR